jgi:GntR family transcriptional regulator/MocR family aminotransferase
MKRIYRQRRSTIIEQLHTAFGDRVHILGDATGLHIVAAFPGIDFTNPTILEEVKQADVHVYAVEHHAIRKGAHCDEIVLGYGNLSSEQIAEGVRRLARGLAPTLSSSVVGT